MLKHFGTQAVGVFCLAQGALAGSLTYGTVEQFLAGSAAVHDVLAETSDTDSFSFAENTPTAVNQAYSIEASLQGATIQMAGSFTSSFASDGFAIEASALATIPNQGAFGGGVDQRRAGGRRVGSGDIRHQRADGGHVLGQRSAVCVVRAD